MLLFLLVLNIAQAAEPSQGWLAATQQGGRSLALVRDANAHVTDSREITAVPQLELRCTSGHPELWLKAGLTLDSGGDLYDDSWALAEIAYDAEAAAVYKLRRGEWRDSARFRKSRKTLNAWLAHDTLTIAFVPFASDPVIATFDLSGLEEAMNHFVGRCSW